MTRKHRRPRQKIPRPSGRRRWPWSIVAALVVVGAAWVLRPSGVGPTAAQQAQVASTLRVEVIRVLPHDTTAYTQGLLWWEGKLYESTGQYGASTLRRVDPMTGQVEQQIAIPPSFFAEGLARVNRELVMLTWKAGRALVFDIERFDLLHTLRYPGEGWGLCYDGARLVMSDGSDTLTFRDPVSFNEIGVMHVTSGGRPQAQLNELECVDGAVYANIWQQDEIVRIDPDGGRVTHRIDASGLLSRDEARGVDVLNGIAHDPNAGTFYITGKWWPKMFEVRFVPSGSARLVTPQRLGTARRPDPELPPRE